VRIIVYGMASRRVARSLSWGELDLEIFCAYVLPRGSRRVRSAF